MPAVRSEDRGAGASGRVLGASASSAGGRLSPIKTRLRRGVSSYASCPSLALLVLLFCFEAVSFWRDSSRSSSKAYFAARSTGTSRCSPLTGLTRTSCFVELPYQRMLILRISRFRPGCPTCSRSPRESSTTTARISRRARTPAGSAVLRFLGAPRPVSGGRRSFRYRVLVEAERVVERELARSSEEDYE